MIYLVVKFNSDLDPIFRRYVVTLSQAEDLVREGGDVIEPLSKETRPHYFLYFASHSFSINFRLSSLQGVFLVRDKSQGDLSFYAIYTHSYKT